MNPATGGLGWTTDSNGYEVPYRLIGWENERRKITQQRTSQRETPFIRNDTGKNYHGRATEVLTMGVERLHENPLEFHKTDPDFFQFVIKL